MLIRFSELPIPFGAVLIDTEGNRYFWVNQLDILLSSGMSKTVEEDWLVLV